MEVCCPCHLQVQQLNMSGTDLELASIVTVFNMQPSTYTRALPITHPNWAAHPTPDPRNTYTARQ